MRPHLLSLLTSLVAAPALAVPQVASPPSFPYFALLDGTSGGAFTLLGSGAGVGITAAAIEATCLGTSACGAVGSGMSGPENTMLGWHAGAHMATGQFNTGIGVSAMNAETTGTNNVAIGVDAMRNSVGLSNSVAIGVNASRNSATGPNISIGVNALYGPEGGASTAADNVAIGVNALRSQVITSASRNIAIGDGALSGAGITSASDNVAIGTNVMQSASQTTAGSNVGVGSSALKVLTGGGNNTAVGANAGTAMQAGSGNTALGYNALSSVVNQGDNTAVGQSAGLFTTGTQNVLVGSLVANAGGAAFSNIVALGFKAGSKITTGGTSTIIGTSVGSTTQATGTGNILIGTSSATDTPAANTSNMLNIGGLVFANLASAAAPALSACGTTPAIDGHANNRTGTVTVGSGTAASCTLTFAGTGYASWSHCRVTPQTAGLSAFGYSYTLAALTVAATSLTGAKFDYDCDGY